MGVHLVLRGLEGLKGPYPVALGELVQVFGNLFNNAAQARAGKGLIEVETVDDGEVVRVRVTDTVPASILPVQRASSRIDGMPAVLGLIAAVAREAGRAVTEADDGKAALALAQSRCFDLLVTDILMPNRDGSSVVMALAEATAGPQLLAISGGEGLARVACAPARIAEGRRHSGQTG